MVASSERDGSSSVEGSGGCGVIFVGEREQPGQHAAAPGQLDTAVRGEDELARTARAPEVNLRLDAIGGRSKSGAGSGAGTASLAAASAKGVRPPAQKTDLNPNL